MIFEIRINGISFTLWESATVNRSIDSNSGAFRFTNSSTAPFIKYPVKTGDFVEILISGKRKIAGFIDSIIRNQDADSHTVEVSGRDNIQDLIDSSIPDGAKVTEGPITLKALCEKVIASLGAKIKVFEYVQGITEFSDEDLMAAGSGSTCMAYLVSFARKRQVYLVPDGSGNLLIFRPDKNAKSSGQLIHRISGNKNNIVSYSIRLDQNDRYNDYLCRSQDNFGFDPDADYSGEGTDRKSTVKDDQIRSTRYLEIKAEETMSEDECKSRAAEQSNHRRSLGTEYMATVPGVTQSDGTVLDFGQFVEITDDYADISGRFLIKSVEYSQDIKRGTRTRLIAVMPDAYQPIAQPSRATERIAGTGAAFQNKTPILQTGQLR